jgi:hypothetical protein
LHVHLHTIVADGVFVKTDGGVGFHEAPPSSKDDIAEVAQLLGSLGVVRSFSRPHVSDDNAFSEREMPTSLRQPARAFYERIALSGAFRIRSRNDRDRRAAVAAGGATTSCEVTSASGIIADISASEVVVAILAHLGLPTEAPPIARARSPGFDFTYTVPARAAAEGATTSRGRRCAAKTTCASFGGSLS